jgi:hypothetical protein
MGKGIGDFLVLLVCWFTTLPWGSSSSSEPNGHITVALGVFLVGRSSSAKTLFQLLFVKQTKKQLCQRTTSRS